MANPRIQEDFDDDFDLPLPSKPSLAASQPSLAPALGIPGNNPTIVTDATPFKSWTCVYPIYIDAKRAYGIGRRRIAREKSCWWPQSQLISDAARRLSLQVFHEPNKTHPRDWENPGRVKVLFKRENGTLLNGRVTNKKQLLEAISEQIQRVSPSQIPLPEQIAPRKTPNVLTPVLNTSSSTTTTTTNTQSPQPNSKLSATGNDKKLENTTPTTPSKQPRPKRKHVPKPPEPIPPFSERYLTYSVPAASQSASGSTTPKVESLSPLYESGVLVETVKVALKQQIENEQKEKAKALESGASSASASGKGMKRKVVRVRG